MRLYFSYLTIIQIFLLTLQSKIIEHILRYKQKSKRVIYSCDYTINHNENEDKNEK